jgi:hypothetical protein
VYSSPTCCESSLKKMSGSPVATENAGETFHEIVVDHVEIRRREFWRRAEEVVLVVSADLGA